MIDDVLLLFIILEINPYLQYNNQNKLLLSVYTKPVVIHKGEKVNMDKLNIVRGIIIIRKYAICVFLNIIKILEYD